MKGHCYDFCQLKDHTTSPLRVRAVVAPKYEWRAIPESAADAISAKAEAA